MVHRLCKICSRILSVHDCSKKWQFFSDLFGVCLILKGYTKVKIERDAFSFDIPLAKKIISCGFAFWIAQMAMG